MNKFDFTTFKDRLKDFRKGRPSLCQNIEFTDTFAIGYIMGITDLSDCIEQLRSEKIDNPGEIFEKFINEQLEQAEEQLIDGHINPTAYIRLEQITSELIETRIAILTKDGDNLEVMIRHMLKDVNVRHASTDSKKEVEMH